MKTTSLPLCGVLPHRRDPPTLSPLHFVSPYHLLSPLSLPTVNSCMTFASPPRSGKRTVCSSARLLPPPEPPDPPDIAPSPPCSLNKYKLHNRLDLNGTGSRRVSPYARVPSSLTVESLSWVGRGLCLHDVATHRRQATTLPHFRDRPITQRIHPSTSPNHYPSHAGFQIAASPEKLRVLTEIVFGHRRPYLPSPSHRAKVRVLMGHGAMHMLMGLIRLVLLRPNWRVTLIILGTVSFMQKIRFENVYYAYELIGFSQVFWILKFCQLLSVG
ncbi:hypothetical protein AALP_AAs48236U000200 [Arabis alpina]|uniref:Uncharacterized protein n=1 Tax=Arabis alpina TaxID=50452 RepID=A0A087FZ69_ARAAL|nr:hypothetical protein AALP_AAs48236U000200 [Arabis alpina]